MAMEVTVVIPAYNASSTIAEALKSVLAQTLPASEIIVVDDGSTDETADVVQSLAAGIVLLRTENRGAASALNSGVEAAQGEVIAFLDADDLWMPEKLELQVRRLAKPGGEDLVMCHYEAFVCPSLTPEQSSRLRYAAGAQPGLLLGCMAIRKRVLDDSSARFDASLRTGYHIDWLRRLRASGIAETILPDVLMRRRIRSGTLGSRTARAGDGLSRDFLEIARRALADKRAPRS